VSRSGLTVRFPVPIKGFAFIMPQRAFSLCPVLPMSAPCVLTWTVLRGGRAHYTHAAVELSYECERSIAQ